MDGFAAVRLVLGLTFLGYASLRDLKTRRIPDGVWIVLGILSLGLLEVELLMTNTELEDHLILIPTAIIFFGVFFGEELWTQDGFRFRPYRFAFYFFAALILVYAVLFHRWGVEGAASERFLANLSMPVLLVLGHVFYQFGLLRGGADAKAFMSIALLVPAYPSLDAGLPLVRLSPMIQNAVNLMFPFALVALMDAAVLLIFLPMIFVVYNALHGDAKGFQALFGYKVDIGRVPKFVWLMDRVENGAYVRVLLPRKKEDREEQMTLLRGKGFDRVWVTPQIPFLLPMTIGFLAAFMIGNVVLGLMMMLF